MPRSWRGHSRLCQAAPTECTEDGATTATVAQKKYLGLTAAHAHILRSDFGSEGKDGWRGIRPTDKEAVR